MTQPVYRVPPECLQLDFWLTHLPDLNQPLLSTEDVEQVNQAIYSTLPDSVFNLTSYPQHIVGETLVMWIEDSALPASAQFINGKPCTQNGLVTVTNNCNVSAIASQNAISYGLVRKCTALRTLPTDAWFSDHADDKLFDLCQETSLELGQTVLVLHTSADKKWYFVQTYNYRGWVAADSTVLLDQTAWLQYLNAQPFLTVTGNRAYLSANPAEPSWSQFSLRMGTRLPLVQPQPPLVNGQCTLGSHVVHIPTHSNCPCLQEALIARCYDTTSGHLPFTRANILTQAFKLLGERYGWGGLFESYDCSSLVMSIFACFGFQLPRNADQQELVPCYTVSFNDLTLSQRQLQLESLQPGSLLFMPGHVMLYLGKYGNAYYCLHALAAAGDPSKPNPDGSLATAPCHSVVVTTLNIRSRRTGLTFLEMLTSGKDLGRSIFPNTRS